MPSSLISLISAGDKNKVPAGYTNLDYSNLLNEFGAAATVTADGTGAGGTQNLVDGRAQVKEVQLASKVDGQGFIADETLKEMVVTLHPKWAIPLSDKEGKLYFATGGVDSIQENSGQIGLSNGKTCPATVTDPNAFWGETYNVGISFSIETLGRKYIEKFYPNDSIGVTGTSGSKADLTKLMEQGQLWAEIAIVSGGSTGKVFHAKVISSETSATMGGDNIVYITSSLLGVNEIASALPAYAGSAKIGDEDAKFEFADKGHDFFYAKINGFSGESYKQKVKDMNTSSTRQVSFQGTVQARIRLWCSKETGSNQQLPEDFYKTNYGDPKEGVYQVANALGVNGVISTAAPLSGSIGEKIAAAAKNVIDFMSSYAYTYAQTHRTFKGVSEGQGPRPQAQQSGLQYCNDAFSMDCSGFCTWCLLEAGATSKTGWAPASGQYVDKAVSLNSGFNWVEVQRNEVQAGDILWRNGHVGIAWDNSQQIDFGCTRWSKEPNDQSQKGKGKIGNPHPITGYTRFFRVLGGSAAPVQPNATNIPPTT